MRRAERVVCEKCGRQFITRYRGARFCSHQCANSRKRGAGIGSCPHNEAIICNERKCGSCGWNPAVAQKRKEAMTL